MPKITFMPLSDQYKKIGPEPIPISKEVPEYWDLIYFGGNHFVTMPTKITEHIFRVYNTVCLHGIAINHTMYDKIIEANYKINRPTDCNIGDLQKSCLAVVTRPHLCWQREGYSDVQTSVQNYEFLQKFETSIPL